MNRKARAAIRRGRRKRGYISVAAGILAVACALAVWLRWDRIGSDGVSAMTPLPTAAESPGASAESSPESIPTPEPTPTPFAPRAATIRAIGDLVIHEAIFKSASDGAGGYDFTPIFTMIDHVVGGADYTVANVEGPMGGKGERGYSGFPKFNTPPELMAALKASGVDMLTLANNHALDEYFDGLKRTMDHCERYGLAFVGAARTREERDRPTVVEVNGIRIGFLSYAYDTNSMEKYSDPAAVEYGVSYLKGADFRKDVSALRAAGAEAVVAFVHWGGEYERKPDATQRAYARRIAEAGADAIVGGHPHVAQPIEWIEVETEAGTRSCLCAYSLGNFLSNQPEHFRDGGIVLEFTVTEITEGSFRVASAKYVPTYYWRRGSERSGYTIRVLPCGEWLDEPPEGMNEAQHARLNQIWREMRDLIGTGVAVPQAN